MNSTVPRFADDASRADHSETSYTMTQLCDEFGLTPRALRFYEQRKLLMPLRRGVKRVYTHRDRVRLKLVLRGKRFGFTLTEIKEMLDLYDAPNGRKKQLQTVLPRLQFQLGALQKEYDELGEVLTELESTCNELSGELEQSAGSEHDGG